MDYLSLEFIMTYAQYGLLEAIVYVLNIGVAVSALTTFTAYWFNGFKIG